MIAILAANGQRLREQLLVRRERCLRLLFVSATNEKNAAAA